MHINPSIIYKRRWSFNNIMNIALFNDIFQSNRVILVSFVLIYFSLEFKRLAVVNISLHFFWSTYKLLLKMDILIMLLIEFSNLSSNAHSHLLRLYLSFTKQLSDSFYTFQSLILAVFQNSHHITFEWVKLGFDYPNIMSLRRHLFLLFL